MPSDFDAIRVQDTITQRAVPLQPYHDETFHFHLAGAQSTGTKKAAALMAQEGRIVDVRGFLDTAPEGDTFIFDVNRNGTSIFTTQENRPTIAPGGQVSTTVRPDVVDLQAGDRITVDIDQVGAATAGSDLYISITVRRLNRGRQEG